jgi:hypothetical protein
MSYKAAATAEMEHVPPVSTTTTSVTSILAYTDEDIKNLYTRLK